MIKERKRPSIRLMAGACSACGDWTGKVEITVANLDSNAYTDVLFCHRCLLDMLWATLESTK